MLAMVFHQEVKDKYDAVLRGEVHPREWFVDTENRNIFVATLIKYPKLVGELEDKSMWKDTIEFIDLVYHSKMPKKNPSSDFIHINLRGLPIPSKEIVKKLTEDESYEGYYEEWNWKYLAYDWLGEYKPKYSRDWVNYTSCWKDDMDLFFVYNMFWDRSLYDRIDEYDCSNFSNWLEFIQVIDDPWDKLPEDLDKVMEYLGRREEDRKIYSKYDQRFTINVDE